MTPEELAVLRQRIAELEARLPAVPAPPPPLPPLGYEAEPRVTVHISTLVGSPEQNYLHRDVRVVRQLVHALALAYSVPAPSQHISKLWVPVLRRLAASRAAGRSWRAALQEAGLEVPDDLDEQVQAIRNELDGLWDNLLEIVALTMTTVYDVPRLRLKGKLEKLFA